MSDNRNLEDIKRRVKEASGDLTQHDDLQESGEVDRQAAEAKSKVDQAADKVNETIDGVKDRLAGG